MADVDHHFPDPPDANACEWIGSPIGISNIITRAQGLRWARMESLDADPELYGTLKKAAFRVMSGRHLFIHDVVIHGVRARIATNSFHLADFCRDHGYGLGEWEQWTGQRPPPRPQLTLYAFIHVPGVRDGTYEFRPSGEIYTFNTSYYGQLESALLSGVHGVLNRDLGAHVLQGALLEVDRRGIFCSAPDAHMLQRLLHSSSVRLHAEGAVCIRLAPPLPEGRNPSLSDDFPKTAKADRARLRAFGFRCHKKFYMQTAWEGIFPAQAAVLMKSRFENVPDASPSFVRRERERLEKAAAAWPAVERDRALDTAARLLVCENARAMVDPAAFFGKEKTVPDPRRALEIAAVVTSRRDSPGRPAAGGDPAFLKPLVPWHELSALGEGCADEIALLLGRAAKTPAEFSRSAR